jgi:predicted glycosyltransferase
MKVMFYVQHLLGIGHLVRASRIATALADAGHDVTVISGGMPVSGFPPAGVALEQLTPLRSADGSFSNLVDETGAPVDDDLRDIRRRQLMAIHDKLRPDCLVIEAYPFARRQMRFELVPLLEHVHEGSRASRAMVVSSVRDILQPKSPERDKATAATVQRHFDLVLVHGDETFAGFGETFSETQAILQKLAYTGIVAPPPRQPVAGVDSCCDVVVSAGGGAVGTALLKAAIGARELTELASARWLVVTGPNLPDEAFEALKREAGPSVTLSRFEPDLAGLIAASRVSVSQAGYNTVADVLRAGCASVLVPFEGKGEQEQLLRAGRLDAAGRAVMLREGALDARTLAQAIGRALDLDLALAPAVNLDGAANSAALLVSRHDAFRREL